MQLYETGFILSPALSDEDAGAFIQQMSGIVAQKNGKMVRVDAWGKRRLAFPIKRFTEGAYVFFTYEGGGDVPIELERRFKQTDTVLRFLTVKRDPRGVGQRRRKTKAAQAAEAAAAAQQAQAQAQAAAQPEAPAPAPAPEGETPSQEK